MVQFCPTRGKRPELVAADRCTVLYYCIMQSDEFPIWGQPGRHGGSVTLSPHCNHASPNIAPNTFSKYWAPRL